MNDDVRGPRIAARTFFQQLRAQGYNSTQILREISDLIGLVTLSIQEKNPPPGVSEPLELALVRPAALTDK
ncbi:hypothetical protein F0U60_06380 [Archangium minus]|uniref:Uncharacterized protein n=1 Tax=Archangium minus TaxID=83450 RepID=A0ABY9WPW4_9BACT|nr:hypothetical protein F0U60_06380 [Archangium minus]